MKEFIVLIEQAIKSSSSFLLKDTGEILKLKSSASSSLDDFCFRSIFKVYKTILSKLKFFSQEYSFYFLSDFSQIEALNSETSDKNRILFNIDGYDLFCIGFSNFSISACIQEKNPETNKFETIASLIYSPIDNRLFVAEKEKGLSINGVKFKRSSITRNYSIYSTYLGIDEKFNRYSNLIILKNINLGLAYLASGNIDLFLAKVRNQKQAFAGIFMCQVCAVPTKINKLEDTFKIESGYYLK